MPRYLRCLGLIPLFLLLAGCATPKKPEPRFGLLTLTLIGALKFEKSGQSIVGDAFMRFEAPGRFELIVTKGPTVTICHLIADKEHWWIEFPMEKRTLSGYDTPGNEELALWTETRRMIAMAIKRAQFQEDFTEMLRGEYESGHKFVIEMSEFRRVVGQILATRLKLTCEGCKASIEIAIRELKS